jgi:hypothetical protein
MRYKSISLFLLFFSAFWISCSEDDEGDPARQMQLVRAEWNNGQLIEGEVQENAPLSGDLLLVFSVSLDPATIENNILITQESSQDPVDYSYTLEEDNREVLISLDLESDEVYTIQITNGLKGARGEIIDPKTFSLATRAEDVQLTEATVAEIPFLNTIPRDVILQPEILITFSAPVPEELIDEIEISNSVRFLNNFTTSLSPDQTELTITFTEPLEYWRRHRVFLNDFNSPQISFPGKTLSFFTGLDETPKMPVISTEELLTKVQEQTFRYFWDFAHPVSGLARERNTSGNTVTIGGSGFGVMAILVGIERGFITRTEGIERLTTIVDFLEQADRFHGVWPHWMNGNTGDVIPFSEKDNGGDLVETAFMIQGLLTVREYLQPGDPEENALAEKITTLWEEVEWDWYTRGGQDVLFWHWSPNFGWDMNMTITGYNEGLIVYVLAASSPTHSIDAEVYHQGWARNGSIVNGNTYYDIELPLGYSLGGPLFFAHYSFMGLDPRNLEDQYADYWDQNVAHSAINQAYVIDNPLNYVGYSDAFWGLTASDNESGYSAHSPTNDRGVVTPTAALSSMPYTPEASIKAMEFFYYQVGDRLWGEYGFYDAMNPTENWTASSFLAIDQGPIVVMIENYRTALLWELFMQNPEISAGLDKLGFTSY